MWSARRRLAVFALVMTGFICLKFFQEAAELSIGLAADRALESLWMAIAVGVLGGVYTGLVLDWWTDADDERVLQAGIHMGVGLGFLAYVVSSASQALP